MQYLTKKELDKMSRDEIKDFRFRFLSKDFKDNKENRQFFNELEFYCEVRFAQETYDRFDKWIAQYNSNESKHPELKLVVRIINRKDGQRLLYYTGLVSDLKKIGKFQYIKGIRRKIPAEYTAIKDNFNSKPL